MIQRTLKSPLIPKKKNKSQPETQIQWVIFRMMLSFQKNPQKEMNRDSNEHNHPKINRMKNKSQAETQIQWVIFRIMLNRDHSFHKNPQRKSPEFLLIQQTNRSKQILRRNSTDNFQNNPYRKSQMCNQISFQIIYES